MDSVYSSPRKAMPDEFGHYPRTSNHTEMPISVPSSRKRDRFFEAFKFRSRNGITVTDENGSPRPPVQRRKSVVDLFAPLRSRQGQEKAEPPKESTNRRTRSISPLKRSKQVGSVEENKCEPKRRKSLGDMVGTLTQRLSQRRKNIPRTINDASPSGYRSVEVIEATCPEEERIASDRSRLSGVFESNLERMVDDFKEMESRRLRLSSESPTPSSNSWSSGGRTLTSREELGYKHEEEEESRCHTPDSYLQLLIKASITPPQDLSPLKSHEHMSETPSPSKLKAVEPLDFLDDASLSDFTDSNNQVHGYKNNYDYSNSGIFVCPKGCSFDDFRIQEKRPVISVCEVDSLYDLEEDLDPYFRQRVDERTERYWDLDIRGTPRLQADKAEIGKNIKLIVAKMTQNYRYVSSTEDCWPKFPIPGLAQAEQSSVYSFENDQGEAWDSIIHGSSILQQDLLSMGPKNIPSFESIPYQTSMELTLTDTIGIRTPASPDIKHETTGDQSCAPRSNLADIDEISLPLAKGVSTPQIHPRRQSDGGSTMSELVLDFEEVKAQEDFEMAISHDRMSQKQQIRSGKQNMLAVPSCTLEQIDEDTTVEFTVRFPGTMNLLSHEEQYPSKRKALSALSNYKLGDLSNFCTYDDGKRVVFAHSLDEPVPNPAKLREKGLELIWLPSLQVVPLNISRNILEDIDLDYGPDLPSAIGETSSKPPQPSTSIKYKNIKDYSTANNPKCEVILCQDSHEPISEDDDRVLQVDPAMGFLGSQYSEKTESSCNQHKDATASQKRTTFVNDMSHLEDQYFTKDQPSITWLELAQRYNAVQQADHAIEPSSVSGIGSESGRVSLENNSSDSDESVEVQYRRSPVALEKSSSTRSFSSTNYALLSKNEHLKLFLNQAGDSVSGFEKDDKRRMSHNFSTASKSVIYHSPKIPECDEKIEGSDDTSQRRDSSRGSISSFPDGFKFTAYADQFDRVDDEEEQEDFLYLNNHARRRDVSSKRLSVSPLLTSRREVFDRSNTPFKILDSDDEIKTLAKGNPIPSGFLEPFYTAQNGNGAFKLLTSENLNFRIAGKPAPENEKGSPKVGALVEIFQAHGIMPQGLKSGLHRAHSPASQSTPAKEMALDLSSSAFSLVE